MTVIDLIVDVWQGVWTALEVEVPAVVMGGTFTLQEFFITMCILALAALLWRRLVARKGARER